VIRAVPRHLAKNAGFVVLARVWSIVLWIVLTPFVLHRLGPERFGVWSLLFLLSGYLTTFDLGLGSSVVKFTAHHMAAREEERLEATLSQITRLYAWIGLAWIVALAALSNPILDGLKIHDAYRSEVRFALLASGAIFALANLISIGTGVLNGMQRMDVGNSIQVLGSLPQIAVLVLGLRAGYGLYAVVASTAVLWGGVALLTLLALRKLAPGLRWPRLTRGKGGGWFRFSTLMQVVNLIVLTQQQVDKILLGAWIGLAAVTPFELGFRVANAVQSLPVLALVPLLPAFAEMGASEDKERLKRACRRGTDLLVPLALGLAACSIPAAPLVIRAWVGPGYPAAEVLAQWLLAGFAINLCTGVGTAAARGSGRPDLEILPGLIGIAVHVAASAVLIPRFGAAGVGPAFCLGMLVWTVIYLARFTRWLKEGAIAFWLPVLVPSVIAIVPAWLTGAWIESRWPAAWSHGKLAAFGAAAAVALPAALVFVLLWWGARLLFRRGATLVSDRAPA
jgi:O-antigen/teichoic acid export membrane protein